MYFSISKNDVHHPDVFVKGEKLQIVSDIKYLGINIDSHLTFTKQVKKVVNTAKLYLRNGKCINNQLSTYAAMLYSMIFPHLWYCIITCSQVGKNILNPMYSLI